MTDDIVYDTRVEELIPEMNALLEQAKLCDATADRNLEELSMELKELIIDEIKMLVDSLTRGLAQELNYDVRAYVENNVKFWRG